MAHKLEYLLDFCNTDLQRRVVQMFIEGRTGPEIAQASGMEHRSGPDTMLRRIKKRAARSGQAPGHFESGVAEGFTIRKVTVQRSEKQAAQQNARAVQIGGDHYRQMKIQPVEFITTNNLDFLAGNVIKYIVRHKSKNGAQDVRKAIHYCYLILEMEYAEHD